MSRPRPPEGVRAVYPDGQVLPLECCYAGRRDGIHVWLVVRPELVPLVPGMELHVDLLPARTSVGLLGDPGRAP